MVLEEHGLEEGGVAERGEGVGEDALRSGTRVDPGEDDGGGRDGGLEERPEGEALQRQPVEEVGEGLEGGVEQRVQEGGLHEQPGLHEVEGRREHGQEAQDADDGDERGGQHEHVLQRPMVEDVVRSVGRRRSDNSIL